ncbi:MAG: iron ABC transporter permease [Oscillospiraceae bacterium]|nr:iron ABC transporter permease [Oscillospiraceae bacterium]
MTKRSFVLPLSVVLCVLLLYLCVRVGSVDTSPLQIARIAAHKIFGTSAEGIEPGKISIIWNIRIPRVLTSFLVGAALSAGGVIMQSVLQNPLASAYTLGVSSGASVGVTGVMIASAYFPLLLTGRVLMPLAGFVCGFLTVAAALALSRLVSGSSRNYAVILTGMVLSLFLNAVIVLVSSFDIRYTARIQLWQMGSFGGSTFYNAAIMGAVDILCLVLLMCMSSELDMLTFGERQSTAMGVNTSRSRVVLLLIASVLTGVSVCFSGIIGFVDLIAPHVVRRIFGPGHKKLLPLSMLYGGTFMALCDLVSRSLFAPREISVGAVTAMIGAPFFAYLFFGRKKL